MYLIIVDYTTNFYDISQIPDKTFRTVITHSKRIFSKFSIPKIVFSDNGPEFTGSDYVRFSKEWDFHHDTSSSHFPESNGQVEHTIQVVKQTLKKAFKYNDDPYLALLATRVSPGPYNNIPPAVLFFNHPIRSTVPSMYVSKKGVNNNKKWNRNPFKVKSTNRMDLPALKLNDDVQIHDGKSWSIKGKVSKISEHPRSYLFKTNNGTILRRNRRHILLDQTSDYDVDDNEGDNDYSLIGLSEVTPDFNSSMLELSTLMDDLVIDEDNNEMLQPVNVNETPEVVRTTRSGRVINIPQRFGEYDLT